MKKLIAALCLIMATLFCFSACGKLALPNNLKQTANDILNVYEKDVKKLGLKRTTSLSYYTLFLHEKAGKSDALDPSGYDFSADLNNLAANIAKATIAQYALGGTMSADNVKTMLNEPSNEGEGFYLTVPAYTLIAATVFKNQVEAKYDTSKLVSVLLSKQQANGGFSNSEFYDIDSTAMILTALSMHKEKPGVSEAIDKAIAFLSDAQDKTTAGYISSNNPDWMPEVNASSTAQVMMALISCNVDPFKDNRFQKDGKSMFDFLLTLKRSDNLIAHSPSTMEMQEMTAFPTEQTLMALGVALRYDQTGKHMYDFS